MVELPGIGAGREPSPLPLRRNFHGRERLVKKGFDARADEGPAARLSMSGRIGRRPRPDRHFLLVLRAKGDTTPSSPPVTT